MQPQNTTLQEEAPLKEGHPFLERLNDEAVNLLLETRDFAENKLLENIAKGSKPEFSQLEQRQYQFRLIHQQYRITSRLASVVSWILYQKGLVTGDIKPETMLESFKSLDSVEVCLEDESNDPSFTELPPKLQELLLRSHRLYTRVARLDRQQRQRYIH